MFYYFRFYFLIDWIKYWKVDKNRIGIIKVTTRLIVNCLEMNAITKNLIDIPTLERQPPGGY
jgi:hypothetical protein